MKLDRIFTVMVVPQSGQGQVRQLMVSMRQIKLAVVGGTTMLLVGLGAHAYTLPKAVEAPVLEAENQRLQKQLQEANQTIGEVADLVDRLKSYDERLKELEAQGALPGMGPLTEEEMADRAAWLEGQARSRAELVSGSDELNLKIDKLRGDLLGFDEDHLGGTLQKLTDRDTVMPLLWPASGPITSPFGYRKSPINGDWGMHGGIDIGAKYGEPILATNQGTVTFSGWDQGHGQMVVVDHGEGVVTRYCHASTLYAREGDTVTAGETIALVGSTGWSTGPHLHYEIFINGERVDPVDYLP